MRSMTVTENPRCLEAVTGDPFITGLEAADAQDQLAAGGHELRQPGHALLDLAEAAIR